MAFFPTVEASMTSPDGKTFMLHVKRPTGGDLLLGFRFWHDRGVVSAVPGGNAD